MAKDPVQNRPWVVVRNFLLTGDNSVLLMLRADTKLWELPGGKVDDEEVRDASVREQLEETGMTLLGEPEFVGFADCVSLKNRHRRFIDLFLRWRDWNGFPMVVEPDSHDKLAWFKLTELPELHKMMPGTRKFFEQCLPKHLEVELLRTYEEPHPYGNDR